MILRICRRHTADSADASALPYNPATVEPRQSIHQLPQNLVNRIAAGEVIERPASVVKELVENSIDAGASHIIVEVEDGGRELIRIIDDGGGIPPDELPLAFASHATSKLLSDEDLFAIRTMGFRGEALASIGSVAHGRILSRTRDGDSAYEIYDRGGAISDPQAAAGNVGTTIEVRNLFFNTPARRKFMKGSATEFGHISEQLLRTALPHPQISFKLLHNGRTVLDLPVATEEDRLLAAWPEDFREQRLPIQSRDAEVKLRGIIGLPELARPTPKYQHLYLNGRPIRDKFVQHALREAYRGLTEPGRYPAAILLLEVPPGDVDVNVHPTKIEVRFRDSGRIHGLVQAVVRERLLGSDLTPSAVPMHSDADDRQRQDMQSRLAAFFRGEMPVTPAEAGPQGLPGNAPHANLPPGGSQQIFFPSSGAEGSLSSPSPSTLGEGRGEGQTAGSFSHQQNYNPHPALSLSTGRGENLNPSSNMQREGEEISPLPNTPGDVSSPSPGAAADHLSPSPGAAAEHLSPSPGTPGEGWGEGQTPNYQSTPNPRSMAAPNSGAIQLHNSYLVAETADGMIIIDQHALHERIMFEDLLARITRGPLEAQRLLIPITLPASSRQMALLEQVQPLLNRLGIEVVQFGPDTVAVQSFPSFLERLDPAEFVRELLERGEQELLDLHEEEVLHEILDMMACKAAVKAGDPLTPSEIQALLSRRDLVERSSNCPHGRPTTLRLTLRDLEKQFKRTGF